jgi:hypothetical protein
MDEAEAMADAGQTPTPLAYSDGSKKHDGAATIGSYGWVIAGIADGKLRDGIEGSGLVHGEPTDITSTRAERLRALACLTTQDKLSTTSDARSKELEMAPIHSLAG